MLKINSFFLFCFVLFQINLICRFFCYLFAGVRLFLYESIYFFFLIIILYKKKEYIYIYIFVLVNKNWSRITSYLNFDSTYSAIYIWDNVLQCVFQKRIVKYSSEYGVQLIFVVKKIYFYFLVVTNMMRILNSYQE